VMPPPAAALGDIKHGGQCSVLAEAGHTDRRQLAGTPIKLIARTNRQRGWRLPGARRDWAFFLFASGGPE